MPEDNRVIPKTGSVKGAIVCKVRVSMSYKTSSRILVQV